MTVTMLLVFGSAFLTDIIGIPCSRDPMLTSESGARYLWGLPRWYHWASRGWSCYRFDREARGYDIYHLPSTRTKSHYPVVQYS